MKTVIALMAAVALAGCAATPTPTGLTPPDARLMRGPPPLIDIPSGDGDPTVRGKYYATSRRDHAVCRQQVQGLQVYARTVAPK